MNKYAILTAMLLTSSVFLPQTAKAIDGQLLEDEAGLQFLNKVGRLKFLEEKSKLAVKNKRLSDKGDLPTDRDHILRRRFFTIGDGDCFFWATDLTRAQAQALWLQHSGNANIRALAADEISEEIIASAIPDALFQIPDLRPRLPQALLEMECLKPHFEEIVNINTCFRTLERNQDELREELDFQKVRVEQRIKAACRSEEVYRFYVQNALAQRVDFMLAPQDFGGIKKTYFINALAEICNRKLVVYNLNEDRTSLIQTHEFTPTREEGIWEVLLDGMHYTRVVQTNRQDLMTHAALKEEEYLDRMIPQVNKEAKKKISCFVDLMALDTNQRKAGSALFNPAEQSDFRKAAASLEEKLRGNKALDAKTKAAYYKVMRDMALNQIDMKTGAALRNEERRSVLEQEIEFLKDDVLFCREALQSLAVEPTDFDVANVLLQLYYYYTELADIEEAKCENEALPKAARDAAKQASEGYNAQKAIYRDAFEALEKTFKSNEKVLAKLCTEAKQRRSNNLGKNLKLYNWSFTDDYNAAKAVADEHFNALKARKQKYFNPEYLSADPFAKSNLPELQEKDISNEDWKGKILTQFKVDILRCLVPAEHFKRVKDYLLDDTIPNKNFRINSRDENILGKAGEVIGVQRIYESITIGNQEVLLVNDGQLQARSLGTLGSVTLLVEAFHALPGVFGRVDIYANGEGLAEQKMNSRKRFMRIHDMKVAQARLLTNEVEDADKEKEDADKEKPFCDAIGAANAALSFVAITGCPDGVIGNLDILEANMAGEAKTLECDISNILAGCAFDFVQNYRNFDPNNAEFTLNGPQLATQRSLWILPHHKAPRTSFYSLGTAATYADSLFAPANLMRTFLKGGLVTLNNSQRYDLPNGLLTLSAQADWGVRNYMIGWNHVPVNTIGVLQVPGQKSIPLSSLQTKHKFTAQQQNFQYPRGTYIQTNCVDFEAFTADGFIDLVHNAYKRAVKGLKDGKIIKIENIVAFIENDPWLSFLHENFTFEGEYCDFFGKNDENGYVKRPFFEYVLTSLGYIINPLNKWEAERKKWEDENGSNVDEKLVDHGIIDIDGKPIVKQKLKLGGSLLKKKDTIEGWAAPITVNLSMKELNVGGWTATPEGAATSVGVFYKGMHLGTIPVNQDSPDVVAHYKASHREGDFSKTRFQGTVSLQTVDITSFDAQYLKIVGIDSQNEFNDLIQVKVSHNGYHYHAGQLSHDGKKLVRLNTLEGWAAPIVVDLRKKVLAVSGWSAIGGVGGASSVIVLYKGVHVGSIPVREASPDVVAHFRAQSKPGDYTRCRFDGILDLGSVDLTGFDEAYLEIMGLNDTNGFNTLAKLPVTRK